MPTDAATPTRDGRVEDTAIGIRALLIDDNPFDRELACRALRGLPVPPGPVELASAGDWAEALPHLEAGGFDLMLLDYHLPGLMGLDILRELQGQAHPPVIMMTGQDDIATAVETLRAGAADYVPKTADWGPALCLAVERVLERARLERELAESRAQLAAHAAELEETVTARTAVVRAQATEIEALYLEAEEAARLKAEIVSNVSHELCTPLNIILGYAELLGESLPPDGAPDAVDMLEKIRTQAERLHQLVESLLALNRLNAGSESVRVSRFTLAELMEELRGSAVTLNAERQLTVAWNVASEPCEVENDREKVRAIAYHLVSNAIKFTAVGQVEVEAATTPDGGIVLTVSDTGIGLPPEAKSVVFDDFRQLDGSSTRRYEGLGIGLGIVKRYTALLGGTVGLESTPGKGTTIVVRLPPPLKRASAADSTGASRGPAPTPT